MAHTYTHVLIHLIFSTKDRLPSLDEKIRAELYPYLGSVIHEMDGRAIAIGGWFDHVHILASISAKHSLSDLMREMKSNSSTWVKRKFDGQTKFGWQTGYGAFSVSRSNIDTVTHYIANQREHHKRVSFQDEFISFLEKHGIAYDQKYIWS